MKKITLGERIRATRRNAGYTQEELAEMVGVHLNTIVRWERDARFPNAEKLRALAAALGCSVSVLVEGDIKTPGPGEAPTLKYWADIVDQARAVVRRGDREEMGDVRQMLEKALAAVENGCLAAGMDARQSSPVVVGAERRLKKSGNAV